MKNENINDSPILEYYKLCGHEQDFHNELEQKKKEYFEDEGIELSDDEVIERLRLDYSLYYPGLVNSTRCDVIDTLKDYLTNTESDMHITLINHLKNASIQPEHIKKKFKGK